MTETVGFDPRCSNCNAQLPMGSKHMDPCPECGTVRLIRRGDDHSPKLKLDYSRDRLLISIAQSLELLLDTQGAHEHRRSLETAEIIFKRQLDALFPDGPETQS